MLWRKHKECQTSRLDREALGRNDRRFMPAPSAVVTPEQILHLLEENAIVEDVSSLSPESDLFVAGLDSMAMMQLLLHLEQAFGVALQPGEITRERFQSAAALAAYLSNRSVPSA